MTLSFSQGMALLRIGFGLYFLSQAVNKLLADWLTSPQQLLNASVEPALQRGTAVPLYSPFLETVVAPNALWFARLVTIGEWLVGISLVLGLLGRVGALGSAFLVLNYMLMQGFGNAGSSPRLFLLASVVFLLTSASLVWGLDGWLRSRCASHPFTRWVAGLAGPAP
jgi:uncharacterized membrane protein YphA (DoxX/SURF4 family)